MANNPRQQGRPSPGDMTGRVKAQMGKEAGAAAEERAAELSMATARQGEDEEFGVFDGKTGTRIDDPLHTAVEVEDDDETEETEAAFFGFPGGEDEEVLSGKESPEEIAPVIARRRTFTRAPAQMVPSALVRIRVEQDIDEMTYGMVNGEPNNYTFKEGLQYEVPFAVAEHLNDLGLIRQFISR